MFPSLKIEVPPFDVVDREPFRLHGVAQEVALPALAGGPAGIVGVRAGRELVVAANHPGGRVIGQAEEGEVDGGASVVLGALGWIGDEALTGRGNGFPEKLGDGPGAVGVVDQKLVALGP